MRELPDQSVHCVVTSLSETQVAYIAGLIDGEGSLESQKRRILEGMREKAYSWAPTCRCDAKVVPCTVLDPFGGAGTTGLVADRLGRDAIMIELNAEYIDIARRRLTKDAGMFAQVTP
jgi:16S rRNA G966 N2-methylase RsmD